MLICIDSIRFILLGEILIVLGIQYHKVVRTNITLLKRFIRKNARKISTHQKFTSLPRNNISPIFFAHLKKQLNSVSLRNICKHLPHSVLLPALLKGGMKFFMGQGGEMKFLEMKIMHIKGRPESRRGEWLQINESSIICYFPNKI